MAASKALKFGNGLKELRLHLCQKSPSSKGARDFIEQHYVNIKQANPKFLILIRECSGVQPVLWARYEFGRESSTKLDNFSGDQVLDAVKSLSQKTA